MSERLRKEYEKKEVSRIEKIVKLHNKAFHARMHAAGVKFKKAHPELFV